MSQKCFSLFLLLASLLLSSCALPKRLALKVIKPAAVKIAGVKTVAIGGFDVQNLDGLVAAAGEQPWQLKALPPAALEVLAADFKSDLLDALAQVPHYRLIDVTDYNRVFDMRGLSGLAGKPTFNPGDAQAVIFGKAWVAYYELSGVEFAKESMAHWDLRGDAPRKISERDEIVQYPYRKISGAVVLQYTMVRLYPRLEVMAVVTVGKNFRQQEGGGEDTRTAYDSFGLLGALFGGSKRQVGTGEVAQEGGGVAPMPMEVFSALSKEVVKDFVSRITPTEETLSIPVAEQGDVLSKNMIYGGAYDSAMARLLDIISGKVQGSLEYKEPRDRWADLHNLGLCYEAQGPAYYLDALLQYERALETDPPNPMVAHAIGRISRLLEDTGLLEIQRSAVYQ
jgi:tetratricopeptide (TPR) repeat protein